MLFVACAYTSRTITDVLTPGTAVKAMPRTIVSHSSPQLISHLLAERVGKCLQQNPMTVRCDKRVDAHFAHLSMKPAAQEQLVQHARHVQTCCMTGNAKYYFLLASGCGDVIP